MPVLADSFAWTIGLFGGVVFLLWGWTVLDIIKSRAGMGYTVGIFFPGIAFFAMVLWWTVGKWDSGDPARAAVARKSKQRLQEKMQRR